MSTNDVVYAELLFNFGSVYVYEVKPKIYDLFNQPVYYWRYRDTAEYYGPFKTIMECCRNWESTVRGTPTLPALTQVNDGIDMSNVIRVDFKNKRRIK